MAHDSVATIVRPLIGWFCQPGTAGFFEKAKQQPRYLIDFTERPHVEGKENLTLQDFINGKSWLLFSLFDKSCSSWLAKPANQ